MAVSRGQRRGLLRPSYRFSSPGLRSAPRYRRLLPGLLVGCTACYTGAALVRSLRDPSFWPYVDGVLYVGTYVLATLECVRRAANIRWRAGWWALPVGLGCYTAGWAYAAIWTGTHAGHLPVATPADAGWLAFYPLAIYAMLSAAYDRGRGPLPLRVWLDGAVCGLGTCLLGAAVVLPHLAFPAGSSAVRVAVLAAYPCADLILLGVAVGVCVLYGLRLSATEWALYAAVLLLVVADTIFLARVTGGHSRFGALLGAGWLCAITTMALCSRAGGSSPQRAGGNLDAHERAQFLPIGGSLTLLALVLDGGGPGQELIRLLAAATLLVSVARLGIAFPRIGEMLAAKRAADTDEVTELVNRRRFRSSIEQRLQTDQAQTGVMVIDLDRFKDVNGTLGYRTGDVVLAEVGHRVRDVAGTDLVARVGGDEFAVLLTETEPELVHQLAATMLTEIRRPVYLDGLDLRLDASIGAAFYPQRSATADDLMRQADIAMYQAKSAHCGFQVFSPSDAPTTSALRLQADLRRALDDDPDQIVMFYQPKLSMHDGTVVGVEALVRWQHPLLGLLSPDQFLPQASQARMLRSLAVRVAERSLAAAMRWQADGMWIPVAINLSAHAATDVTLPSLVSRLLDNAGAQPAVLSLEITEEFLLADHLGARGVLDALREGGVRISIDDYGSGYSSLAYLRDLAVDELKLDRSFISRVAIDARAAAIVSSTIDLAHSLDLILVAEGVEHIEQWDALEQMGCDVAQGFFIAEPMPEHRLLSWLRLRERQVAHSRQIAHSS